MLSLYINQVMNKHGVSRRCFTETDVKHFKSGALRTITNIVHEYCEVGEVVWIILLEVLSIKSHQLHPYLCSYF